MNIKILHLGGKLLSACLLRISSISVVLAVSGCLSPNLVVPNSLEFERSEKPKDSSILGDQQAKQKHEVSDTPKPPALRIGNAKAAEPPLVSAEKEQANLMVAFDQLPLPAFIQAVYGPVLKLNYSVDGAVSARTDLVTFRTPKPQTQKQMAELTRLLLKSYGIAVQDFGGVTRIVPDTALNSYSPQIRRGLAQPDVPISLRPIFHYVELEAVRVSDFSGLLKTMFGAKIQVQDDSGRNALLISGQPEDVTAVLEVIQVFDQPFMRGQRSKRVSPVYWTADEFSKRLVDVLAAEGYSASTSVANGTPILILPIAPLNSVIIFAASDKTLAHALKWAEDLDQPSSSQAGGAYFTYSVKYADAQALAKTLSELISPGSAAVVPAGGAQPPAAKRPSRIVVNNTTNSLIIQGGGPDEYRQWLTLLAELDKPTKSALIDVIVAEVTLSDSNTLGIDWTFAGGGQGTPRNNGGVITSASGGAAGLTINFLSHSGLIKARLNALASQSNAQILSSPKIIARNGETATIQVGDEVPIITSQQTTPIAGTPNTSTNSIVSTVQYRSTGVILKVRPIINSGNRIDLDISQEVSNARSTQTGVSSSPTISTRKIDTKLSLRDGSTVLLAGLITNNNNESDSGVPLLKDIPVLGNIFKTTTTTKNKTELVILITPYIINDDFEAESITAAFQNTLGDWARDLKERAAISRLKRLNSPAPTLEKSGKENSPSDPIPAEGNKQLPASALQSVIEAPAEKQVVPPAPLDKRESAIPSDVIMSKPEPVVAPAPSSKLGGGKAATPGKLTKGAAPPVNGRAVEDENLLEELRRAVGK